MTNKLCFVTIALVAAFAVTGLAIGLEIGVGTEPSVSFAATWDLSPSLTILVSLGAAFGGDVQTGPLNAQAVSYAAGVELRYRIRRFALSSVSPYLGLGAFAQLSGGDMSVLLSSSAGMQIRILPNIYLVGEGSVLMPILDVSGWYWRLKLGVGFRF